MERLVWVGVSPRLDRETKKKIVAAALEQGFTDVVLAPEDRELAAIGRMRAMTFGEDGVDEGGTEVARIVTIRSHEDEKGARKLRGHHANVIIVAEDWKVIPLENLIAHFQGSGTRLLVQARDVDEAKLFLETLEVGSDGLLFSPHSPRQLRELKGLLESRFPHLELQVAEVKAVRQLGLGDRVCVDTCSLMGIGEGILVGNSSSALFLVQAESIETGYVPARPFRVNAGPVHAYVLLPDGRTKYLSELRSGDQVMAVDRQGRGKPLVVGRCKIERRPLVLVEAEAGDRTHTTIVQNAETIRFVTPDGVKAVPELTPGDRLLVRLEEGGRHFGMAIKETIMEK